MNPKYKIKIKIMRTKFKKKINHNYGFKYEIDNKSKFDKRIKNKNFLKKWGWNFEWQGWILREGKRKRKSKILSAKHYRINKIYSLEAGRCRMCR